MGHMGRFRPIPLSTFNQSIAVGNNNRAEASQASQVAERGFDLGKISCEQQK